MRKQDCLVAEKDEQGWRKAACGHRTSRRPMVTAGNASTNPARPSRIRQHPRHEEQPPRAAHQERSAASASRRGRFSGAARGYFGRRVQRDRHFGDRTPAEARLDDHLGREFHADAAQIETAYTSPGETAQAAVNVVDRRFEPPSCQPGEHRVSPPAMQRRHRARRDRPAAGWQATALHQILSVCGVCRRISGFRGKS